MKPLVVSRWKALILLLAMRLAPPVVPAFLALGTFNSSAPAQRQPAAPSQSSASGSIVIAHVTVVDTNGGEETQDKTVVISGDRISGLGDTSGAKAAANATVVDGRGKFLIPGLWDMHVHSLYPDRLDSMFPIFIANGVLGVRDMGTSMPLAEIDRLRHEVANGSRLGPRFVAAGPILDGHPKPMRPNFLAITTPQQGRETVRALKAGGR